MKPLEEKFEQYLEGKEAVKSMPPNEVTQVIRKRLSDIRDLLVKADVAMDTGKNPSYLFDRMELLLEEIDNLKLKT